LARRALIIATADLRPPHPLEPGPSLTAIQGILARFGGWSLELLTGLDARREAMLAALERLVAATEPGDAVLFYFFGHGGAVRFTDGPGALGSRPVFYLSAAHRRGETGRSGILDQELSHALRRIDAVCGNVSAILDCCHSGQIVRNTLATEPAPAWVHTLAETDDPPLLGHDGHPRIVRLAATSSFHFAFARPLATGQRGYLTEALFSAVEVAGAARARLCWDHIAHWAREHAIQARGYEEQWVSLAGPRQRLLFSTESTKLPRTVGFVPAPDGAGGWLRAGLLGGLEIGGEWAVLGLALNAELRPVELARVVIVEINLNRARVELIKGNIAELVREGCCAHSVRRKSTFVVATPSYVELELPRYPPLEFVTNQGRTVGADASWRPSAHREHVVATLETSGLSSLELEQDAALDLVGDWARSQSLTRVLEQHPSATSSLPIEVRWARVDPEADIELPLHGAVLRPGQKVFFQVHHRCRTPQSWYVSLIEIDAAGRPILLNDSEPDGCELKPRQAVFVGRRSAGQRGEGLELRWPEVLPPDGPREVRVIVLMSLRPMQLGHIVHVREPCRPRSVFPAGEPTRGTRAPHRSSQWAWTQIAYQLDPNASSAEAQAGTPGLSRL
jgi:hypothetical protein